MRQLIDAANLRTAVRAARSGSSEVLPRALLEGGSVSPHAIMATDPVKLGELFGAGALGKAVALGAAATSGGPLMAFEKLAMKRLKLIFRQPAVPLLGRKQCCATWLLWKMRLQRFALL